MKKEDRIEAPELSELTSDDLLKENSLQVNGQQVPEEDDTEEDEDDLVLGDEDEIEGDEEEFEVDLEDDAGGEAVNDDDLIIDTDDDDDEEDEDVDQKSI